MIARLKEAFPPQVHFTDSWGHMDEAGYSIEINLGDEPEVMSIMLHVR